jgi:hypothetical protein
VVLIGAEECFVKYKLTENIKRKHGGFLFYVVNVVNLYKQMAMQLISVNWVEA